MAGGKGKSKKQGRNSKWCEAYRLRGQREINKARKLARHLRRFPWDRCALDALQALSPLVLKKAGVTVPELKQSPAERRRILGTTLTALKRADRFGEVA
jgi:hypothetical protein